ncbi:MAG: hypothetical protein AAGA99_19620 [Actinomycetota bacterium]
MALSVSDPEDADEATIAALDEVFLGLSSALLEAGYGLTYGGDLRLRGFGDRLLKLAGSGGQGRIRIVLAPFVAELADADALAAARDIAEIVVVDVTDPPAGLGEAACRARELAAMRRWVTDHTAARIVVGGRVLGSAGVAPGVLEEAYVSVSQRQPTIVLGGFGGVSELAARAIAGEDVAVLSRVLDADSGYSRVTASLVEAGEPVATPAEMLRVLQDLAKGDASVGSSGLVLGSEPEDPVRSALDALRSRLT